MLVKISHDKYERLIKTVSEKEVKELQATKERFDPEKLYLVYAFYCGNEAGEVKPVLMLKWTESIAYPLPYEGQIF